MWAESTENKEMRHPDRGEDRGLQQLRPGLSGKASVSTVILESHLKAEEGKVEALCED